VSAQCGNRSPTWRDDSFIRVSTRSIASSHWVVDMALILAREIGLPAAHYAAKEKPPDHIPRKDCGFVIRGEALHRSQDSSPDRRAPHQRIGRSEATAASPTPSSTTTTLASPRVRPLSRARRCLIERHAEPTPPGSYGAIRLQPSESWILFLAARRQFRRTCPHRFEPSYANLTQLSHPSQACCRAPVVPSSVTAYLQTQHGPAKAVRS
jgi:hypothetical protein